MDIEIDQSKRDEKKVKQPGTGTQEPKKKTVRDRDPRTREQTDRDRDPRTREQTDRAWDPRPKKKKARDRDPRTREQIARDRDPGTRGADLAHRDRNKWNAQTKTAQSSLNLSQQEADMMRELQVAFSVLLKGTPATSSVTPEVWVMEVTHDESTSFGIEEECDADWAPK